jgi:predicted RNA binding protein with dsRBD fold (UPF0201 family)
MHAVVRGRVYPTEAQERVEQAIMNIVAGSKCTVVRYDTHLELEVSLNEASSLEWLRQRIHDLRIIDATRVRLQSNWDGIESHLCLDKQAAFWERIRVIDDSDEIPPLGSIEIVLGFDTPTEFHSFVSWLTPRTEKGRIVER